MDFSTIILIFGIAFIFLRSKKFYTWICLKFKLNILKKVKYNAKEHDPQSIKIDGNGQYYPNFDHTIWLRSCVEEIIEPVEGLIIGNIPDWLNGCLLCNGPGNWKIGDVMYQHLFDCSALLQQFTIKNCHVTYQNRFVQTETLRKNKAAGKIVVTEFGTAALPDPCHAIFDKVLSIYRKSAGSDNALMSIYPFGHEYYAFSETPFIHKINPQTLATEKRICLSDFIGIASHTSHPQIMSNLTIYNLSMSITKSGCVYNIIHFPHDVNTFENAQIVANIPCRWKLNPCYMHTFGITDNYFIIVEQPLSISLMEYVKAQLCNQNLANTLKWFPNKPVLFHLVERQTGRLSYTYQSDAFFYLHIINQYEEDNHVIIDICCYKNPEILNCMYLESIINMQSNPNYAALLHCRPLRFVLPLPSTINNHIKTGPTKSNARQKLLKSFTLMGLSHGVQQQQSSSNCKQYNLNSVTTTTTTTTTAAAAAAAAATTTTTRRKLVHSLSHTNDMVTSTIFKGDHNSINLVNLTYTTAEAYNTHDGSIYLKPEVLCDVNCETPQIYYERYLGKPFRYFYAISYDVNAKHPGILIKVDVFTRTCKQWYEVNCYPSEPIFVASPDSREEDDGLILAVLVWGGFNENKVGLLILCAKTWIEKARCIFHTSGPIPKTLHSWFTRDIS